MHNINWLVWLLYGEAKYIIKYANANDDVKDVLVCVQMQQMYIIYVIIYELDSMVDFVFLYFYFFLFVIFANI